MKVLLFADETLDLNLDGLLMGLNARVSRDIDLRKGRARFGLGDSFIRYPDSYDQLSKALVKETNQSDLSICFTKIPYDNNYFFEGKDGLVIVSFYRWEQLTSVTN